jgi:hypothetical protein
MRRPEAKAGKMVDPMISRGRLRNLGSLGLSPRRLLTDATSIGLRFANSDAAVPGAASLRPDSYDLMASTI